MTATKSDRLVLSLLGLRGIGRSTARRIAGSVLDRNNSIDDLSSLIIQSIEQKLVKTRFTQDEVSEALASTNSILDQLEDAGASYFSFLNPSFPDQLNRIKNPPAVLFTWGDSKLLDYSFNIAVVGTREPTEYAEKVGERLVEIFVQSRFNIVSGLALGCDSIAHKAALKFHGKTVAVLPSGLLSIYPRSNQSLAIDIIDNGGLLISEYLPKAAPQKSYFVERDRLQSALSRAVCVLETDIKGGTMHTVQFARHQQRKIVSILTHPSNLLAHPKLQGNLLIEKEGWGKGIRSKEDLDHFLAELEGGVSDLSKLTKPARQVRKKGKKGRSKSNQNSLSNGQVELPF